VNSDIRVVPEKRALWDALPKPSALEHSTMAIKEYLGRLQLYILLALEKPMLNGHDVGDENRTNSRPQEELGKAASRGARC
jgi:hypothetical protein